MGSRPRPVSLLSKMTVTAAAFLLLAGGSAQAATVTVTLTPAADTSIYQGTDPGSGEIFEDNSCGAGGNLFVGITNDGFTRRALLRFDVSGIPDEATIDAASLTVTVDRSGDNQDAPMTVHRVLTPWNEGTTNCDAIRGGGQGLDATPGDATWLDAMFQQVAWGSAGGDFAGASATALIGTRGDSTWPSGLVGDVQAWVNGSQANDGWILVGDEGRASTTRRMNSREAASPPVLSVTYTTTEEVASCCFTDGACSILTTSSCTDSGGTPNTSGTCSPNPCPQPVGACCNSDESCSGDVERASCESAGGIFQGEASTCSDNNVDCGLAPFVDPLPLPGVLQPVGVRADGVPQYQVEMVQVSQQLHRDLPNTDVWGYNGLYPGPTIEATVGQPIEVRYINNLPAGSARRGRHQLEVDECAHGPNYWQDTVRTVPHLHGGHVPARFDGQPEYDFMPGEFDVYQYPNNQLPATLWYHDHALGITRLNVYMGLAAYYILRDDFENSLGLPAGEFEIPAVIQDREFNADGSLFYPPTLQDAFFGNKILVNGKVWPFQNVKQGKYRLRLLNGSQARVYKLRLENLEDPAAVIPFQLIGTDGGLIDAPLALNSLDMAPAERLDVVVDFGSMPAGTEIVLRNDNGAQPRMPNVMKFIVGDQAGFTDPLPSTLRPVPAIPESEAAGTRRFLLERVSEPCSGGEWLIKSLNQAGEVIGEHWDDLTEFPILGTTEIWQFENASNAMHPMHVHLVMFQVLDKVRLSDGSNIPLKPWEINTWKDTVAVPPGSKVRVIARFEDYPGKFPYHCHILDHEDHEMMRQFQAINDPALCNGNGICEENEDCISCAVDCGKVSGAVCGNGLCEIGDGEDCQNCAEDCAGKAKGKSPYCCGLDAGCDDPRCTDGFFCREAVRVEACCGDMLCEGQETLGACDLDCAFDTPVCTPTSSRERSGKGECDDGLDNDCDGLVDGEDADCGGATVCTDGDSDSFFAEGGDCGPADCDDADPQVNPDAAEVCTDGIDNDCDGFIDDADTDCGGGTCDLGQAGDTCVVDGDCCSSSCKGKQGAKTCK